MPRKRDDDLRNFWPWFERYWQYSRWGTIFHGGVPPAPGDWHISGEEPYQPASPRTERILLVVRLMLAALAVAALLWLVFVAE
jgi:hypothetical protein